MRSNLVPEDRTNINGVTSRRWVRPVPAPSKNVASLPSPAKHVDAAAVAQKQKIGLFSAFLKVSHGRATVSPSSSGKADRVLKEMSNHLDSLSPSAIAMMHAKLVDPQTAISRMDEYAYSLCWDRESKMTTNELVRFVALSDYHRYAPSVTWLGAVRGYLEGVECYEFNPDELDFEDPESVIKNGMLLRFTMDVAASTRPIRNDLLSDDGFMIRSERLAKMVLMNAEMFEEQPERMTELIALANERGAEAAADLYFSADYDRTSALAEGTL